MHVVVNFLHEFFGKLLEGILIENILTLFLQSDITYNKISVFGSIDDIEFTIGPSLFISPFFELGDRTASRNVYVALIVDRTGFLGRLCKT